MQSDTLNLPLIIFTNDVIVTLFLVLSQNLGVKFPPLSFAVNFIKIGAEITKRGRGEVKFAIIFFTYDVIVTSFLVLSQILLRLVVKFPPL